jgi:hypothetical protein
MEWVRADRGFDRPEAKVLVVGRRSYPARRVLGSLFSIVRRSTIAD